MTINTVFVWLAGLAGLVAGGRYRRFACSGGSRGRNRWPRILRRLLATPRKSFRATCIDLAVSASDDAGEITDSRRYFLKVQPGVGWNIAE